MLLFFLFNIWRFFGLLFRFGGFLLFCDGLSGLLGFGFDLDVIGSRFLLGIAVEFLDVAGDLLLGNRILDALFGFGRIFIVGHLSGLQDLLVRFGIIEADRFGFFNICAKTVEKIL